MYINTKNHTKS